MRFRRLNSSCCRSLGLPWWLSGKEPTCRCRRHGFDPGSRKMPHALEQLSPCTSATSLCSTREATAVRSLSIATGEGPTATKTQHSQVNKSVRLYFKKSVSALAISMSCVLTRPISQGIRPISPGREVQSSSGVLTQLGS